MVLTIVWTAPAAIEETDDPPVRIFQERTYQGKPIAFWLKVLRDRNEDLIPAAFDAIRSLEADAWVAVPDLTRLVAAPFAAIQTGRDSHEVIASKLYDIAIRTEAVDTLAWMGESGAPATFTLVQWALTERVALVASHNPDDMGLFIELVAMDAEQRMRVAGAVSAFGAPAFPAVARLLTSPDAAARKLAVAILSQDVLPLAAELLQSEACEDRKLGFLVLMDMDLIVPQRHIDELAKHIRENCTMLSKVRRRPLVSPLSSTK